VVWWGVAVLVLVANTALYLNQPDARSHDTAYLIGTIVGAFLVQVLVVLVVLGIARLIRRARLPAGGGRAAFFTLAALLLINLAGTLGKAGLSRVTEADRAGLEVTQDSIRHAAFGFALPRPREFVADSQLQQRLDSSFEKTPTLLGWGFRDEATGRTIVVMVTKNPLVNETTFRAFVTGVRRGFDKSNLLTDSLAWHGDEGEYLLDLAHPNGVYLSLRCLPSRTAFVCVQTTTAELHELESVTSGLTVARR
jgi:hypothetical protein